MLSRREPWSLVVRSLDKTLLRLHELASGPARYLERSGGSICQRRMCCSACCCSTSSLRQEPPPPLSSRPSRCVARGLLRTLRAGGGRPATDTSTSDSTTTGAALPRLSKPQHVAGAPALNTPKSGVPGGSSRLPLPQPQHISQHHYPATWRDSLPVVAAGRDSPGHGPRRARAPSPAASTGCTAASPMPRLRRGYPRDGRPPHCRGAERLRDGASRREPRGRGAAGHDAAARREREREERGREGREGERERSRSCGGRAGPRGRRRRRQAAAAAGSCARASGLRGWSPG